MSDVPGRLPERPDDRPRFYLDVRRRPAQVDVHRDRGLELTPEETVARRRNRRWMLGIVVPSVAVLAAALLTTGVAAHNAPTAPQSAAPAGYRIVNDGYYSYAVPSSWTTNQAYTDAAGDVETSGASGWVGEHIAYRTGPPVIGESRPASLEAFGMPQPTPYQLTAGHPVQLPGTTTAFEYTVTRPGGFQATAIDAWSVHSGVEIWLFVHGPPQAVADLLTTFRA